MAGAVVFMLTAGWLTLDGAARGPLRIDEGHKIADTYFYRLLLQRDFRDPAWTAHIVDRTNPPVGKFLFGAAASLQGAPLATSLSMRTENPDGTLGQTLAEGSWPAFQPTLVALRRATIAITALTAALLAFASARLHGLLCAVTAAVLYSTAYLPRTFAATAIYDPILALAAAGSLVAALPFLIAGSSTRARAAGAVAGGLLGAVAFQTRLSGLIVPAAFVVLVLVAGGSGRWRSHIRDAAIALGVCAAAGFALNPYYWIYPGGPLRALMRQISDLQLLLGAQDRLHGVTDRVVFAWEVLAGDLAGFLLLLACALALLFLLPHGARDRRTLAAVSAWAAALAGGTILWLPVPWPRYLLVAMVPLAFLAAFGVSELAVQIATAVRDRARTGQRTGT
jgi:hypothetical protein